MLGLICNACIHIRFQLSVECSFVEMYVFPVWPHPASQCSSSVSNRPGGRMAGCLMPLGAVTWHSFGAARTHQKRPWQAACSCGCSIQCCIAAIGACHGIPYRPHMKVP